MLGWAYIAKAEALIELLEFHDCGSVGDSTEVGGDSLNGLLYLEDALKPSSASTLRRKRKAEVRDTSAVLGGKFRE